MQIQISWLLQKPTDLDLHCLQNRVYPGSAGQGLIHHDLLSFDMALISVLSNMLLHVHCFLYTLFATFSLLFTYDTTCTLLFTHDSTCTVFRDFVKDNL